MTTQEIQEFCNKVFDSESIKRKSENEIRRIVGSLEFIEKVSEQADVLQGMVNYISTNFAFFIKIGESAIPLYVDRYMLTGYESIIDINGELLPYTDKEGRIYDIEKIMEHRRKSVSPKAIKIIPEIDCPRLDEKSILEMLDDSLYEPTTETANKPFVQNIYLSEKEHHKWKDVFQAKYNESKNNKKP